MVNRRERFKFVQISYFFSFFAKDCAASNISMCHFGTEEKGRQNTQVPIPSRYLFDFFYVGKVILKRGEIQATTTTLNCRSNQNGNNANMCIAVNCTMCLDLLCCGVRMTTSINGWIHTDTILSASEMCAFHFIWNLILAPAFTDGKVSPVSVARANRTILFSFWLVFVIPVVKKKNSFCVQRTQRHITKCIVAKAKRKKKLRAQTPLTAMDTFRGALFLQ